MWIESNGMLGTMLKLKREHQIPSLSVHDSLLVPARSAEIAQAVLKQQFQYQRGITPLLKVNWSKTPTSQPERPEGPEDTKEATKGESRVG
jgi:hypothetical protein